jgi:hypothetical protein
MRGTIAFQQQKNRTVAVAGVVRRCGVLWQSSTVGDPDPLVRGTDPDPSIIKQK